MFLYAFCSIGGASSKPIQGRCLFTLVVVTLIAYCHDVRRENLTFWLFHNYVKSDLMSNNMKMNGDMRNLIILNVNISIEIQILAFTG